MRLRRIRSILFQVTALFILTSVLAVTAVLLQSTILRMQSLQTLADEIRQSEATLFKKTAQVARERMAHYAYAADPGQSSVWQLRGRRSPVSAIKSENQRRIEIVIGPIYERLNEQNTISTLAIISPEGQALFAFGAPSREEQAYAESEASYELTSFPDFTLSQSNLTNQLESGYAVFAGQLQHFVVFPIFSNAKVMAYIYYGVNFQTLKKAFEVESGSTVWRENASHIILDDYVLAALQQASLESFESTIFTFEDDTYVLGRYISTTEANQDESFLFVKDISRSFESSRQFQIATLLGLIMLLILFGYMVFFILRRRLRPLGGAIDVLRDLSNGDLNSKVDYTRDDEIGRISKAIDVFRGKLVNFNAMNNEARRQRMKQQEEVLLQTTALVALLPIERREALDNTIKSIDKKIAISLESQRDEAFTIGDNSVSELFSSSFSLLSSELAEQYRVLDDKVRHRTIELEKKSEEIARALNQNETLLLNILPRSIAERMKNNERTIADEFADSSILFADIVGFTQIAEKLGPSNLVNMLNGLFTEFDALSDQLGLEKIKTIGDSYMVAGGVPLSAKDHCVRIAKMALMMQKLVAEQPLYDGKRIRLRVGLHTGPVIAGVIGKRKFAYDLWGDAVNVAARMESHGLPEKIHVSQAMEERLNEAFFLSYRDTIEVKGKGSMATYWLEGER
ncbi:MAG: hypothetical protein CBB86_10820 [Candidatus Endolissoclinum sp. TMED26]|nr:MAG: hypothetical protein CBB86_10820 [Candidatus Endolissoclinum sp. TMED26]